MQQNIFQHTSNDNQWISVVYVGNNSHSYALSHNPNNAELNDDDNYYIEPRPIIHPDIQAHFIFDQPQEENKIIPQKTKKQLTQFIQTIKSGLDENNLKDACNKSEEFKDSTEKQIVVGLCFLSFMLSNYEMSLAQEVFRCIVDEHDLQRVLSETIAFIKTRNLSMDCTNIRFWSNQCGDDLANIRLLEIKIIACAHVLENGLSLDLNARMLTKRNDKKSFKPYLIVTAPMIDFCENMML